MTVPPPSPTPLVIHVLPDDIARGAQVFARKLRDHLDGPGTRHRTLVLFDTTRGTLEPDHHLRWRSGRLRSLGFDPVVARRLRAELRALAPDVVVAHGGEPLKYCARATPPGCRLVYYKVGSSGGLVTRRLHTAWHRQLVRAADRVVAISHEMADEVVDRFGARPEAVTIIPNGREPERFRPTDHGAPVVQLLYLAHMTPAKRPLWFVELVRRLHGRGLPVEGLMIGDGPLLEPVRTAAAGLPIRVPGSCRWEEVPELLAGSHVLVFPSEPVGEGMPGAHIEAGMAGLPVVTTAVPGATTVIENGVTGYVTPVTDLDALVGRTADLVGDTAWRSTVGEAARRRCRQRFTLDAVARSWAELLAAGSDPRAAAVG